MSIALVLKTLYGLLVMLFAVRTVVTSRWFAGVRGEWRLRFWIKTGLSRDYLLFNNVTLPTARGTAQIDHILVSRYGVFVIETKNLKGWIFGDANGNQWTQKLYQRNHRFYNPIKQNAKHVQIVQQTLGIDAANVFSLIVFVGNSEFKTAMPDYVVNHFNFIRFIKRHNQRLFNNRQVHDICNTLQSKRLRPCLKTAIAHIWHAKRQRKKAARRKYKKT